MPERVTREERKISMAIQKARDAKEILYHSLMDNNRSPMDDESEHVKLKRPKAENDTTKFESNDGPTTLHAYAGEMKKALLIIKAVRESDYQTNPMLDDEARRTLIMMIDETESAMEALRAEVEGMKEKGAKINDVENVKSLLSTLGVKATKLEQKLQKIPEQTAYYSSEASNTTLDDNF